MDEENRVSAEAGFDDSQAAMRQAERRKTFRRSIGVEVESLGIGEAVLTLKVSSFHLQSVGTVHGGVYATLIDSTIANAVMTVRGKDGGPVVTTELNVSFLRAVQEGVLRATARVEHSGRRMLIGSCVVTDETGERVALGKATFLARGANSEVIVSEQ